MEKAKHKLNSRKLGLIFLMICLITSLLYSMPVQAKNQKLELVDLNNKEIIFGVEPGTPSDESASAEFPNAEFVYVTSVVEGIAALKAGKIDALTVDETNIRIMVKDGLKGIRILEPSIGETFYSAIGLSPATDISGLEGKVNSFLSEIHENGVFEDIYDRWLIKGDYNMPDIPKAENPNFVLKVGTTGLSEPYTYFKGTELTGMDIEIAYRLAAYLGADIQFYEYTWDGLIPAVKSGTVDCALSNLYATPERKTQIGFSDPLIQLRTMVIVRDTDATSSIGIVESIQNSFHKNFVKENRWKLLVSGLGVTALISVAAGILGLLIGFGVCLMKRSRYKVLSCLAGIFIRLLQGTPIVVLLMIFYYVIFNKTGLDGVTVSIIAFGMNFGAYTAEILRSGIEAVDKGQLEAAAAIGFNRMQTFWKIVFPQAAAHFLPVLQGEYISLVKMTSVVGYVAVQDLTKASDIIRSRTYEAFFPLIIIAIIYFILSWILVSALRLLDFKIDPKKRKLNIPVEAESMEVGGNEL